MPVIQKEPLLSDSYSLNELPISSCKDLERMLFQSVNHHSRRGSFSISFGDPMVIRTPDPLIRSQVLCPAEL